MVFYKGRAPKGNKTEWKLNEYRAAAAAAAPSTVELGLELHSASSASTCSAIPKFRQELSLCRLYKRSKCLRSFDRRPSSSLSTIGEGSGRVDHPAPARSDPHEATTTAVATTSYHENQNSSSPILTVNRNIIMPSSSPSADASSSLGDNSNTNINHHNPSDRLDSDLPIWEWEWGWDW